MKKFTLLCCCLLTGLTSVAQQTFPSIEAQSSSLLQSKKATSGFVTTPLKITQPPKAPVYDNPSGEKVYYARTAYGYYYDWDTFTFGKREGGISIIYAEDGTVYFHNPISGWGGNSYLQGKMTDEGIEVTLPQLILEEPDFDNPGQNILFYVAVMKCVDSTADYVTYEVVEEDVTFLIDEEGNISYNLSQNQETPNFDRILGLCDDKGNLYFGDAAQYLNEVNLSAVTPPSDLEYEDWLFYTDGESHGVKVLFDGEDVYLRNFDFIYAPNTWIKGKLDGDTITFESGQFLTETEGFFYRFLAATLGNNGYTKEPSISFSYNDEKKIMKAEENQCMVSNPVANTISYSYPQFMSYDSPVLKSASAGITSNVPQNPKFVAYLDMTDISGMYFCEFDIYPTSIDFDPLPTSQLSFRVYINDAIIDNFASDPLSTDFPYGFWGEDFNVMTILQLGTNVVMYLYFEGCDSIGMQLVNTTPEGEEYESALVMYDVESETVSIIETSDVGIVVANDIVSSEHYDINGIKCDPLSKGLHIIIDRHSDGSVSSRKIIVK